MRTLLPRTAVLLAALVVVLGLPPDPAAWRTAVTGMWSGSLTLDAAAVLVAGTALWLLASWVVVVLGAAGLAHLPGAAGTLGRAAVGVLVPRVLRGIVLGGVAGGLLLGPAVAAGAVPVWPTSPAAPASPAAPTTAAPAWPTAPAPTTPPTSTPAPAAPTTPAPAAPATAAPPTSVTVRPGDSLWSITAGALRARGEEPSAARVVAAWPAWYAANRAVIGADPGLLHPGTSLTPPTTGDGSTS